MDVEISFPRMPILNFQSKKPSQGSPLKRRADFDDEYEEAFKRLKIPSDDSSESSPMIEDETVYIKICTLSGKTLEVMVCLSDTVQQMKEIVETKEGIPPTQQRLIFKGSTLADERTIRSYPELRSGSVIHIVLALRGGVNVLCTQT